jgi:hypothetical protein
MARVRNAQRRFGAITVGDLVGRLDIQDRYSVRRVAAGTASGREATERVTAQGWRSVCLLISAVRRSALRAAHGAPDFLRLAP